MYGHTINLNKYQKEYFGDLLLIEYATKSCYEDLNSKSIRRTYNIEDVKHEIINNDLLLYQNDNKNEEYVLCILLKNGKLSYIEKGKKTYPDFSIKEINYEDYKAYKILLKAKNHLEKIIIEAFNDVVDPISYDVKFKKIDDN